jgi:nicotinate-nucleotide adenylyltransferase
VRERFLLDLIYFVPTWIQPLKQHMNSTNGDDRLRMTSMAIRSNPFFRISGMEINRRGISYSIDTVKIFSRRFGDVYFLIGMDAFSDIGLWKDCQELFFYTHFIVMVRPGRKIEGLPGAVEGHAQSIDSTSWEHESGKKIHIYDITQLDISSTKIRELVRNGNSIKYLVPTSVERYITKRGLYTE